MLRLHCINVALRGQCCPHFVPTCEHVVPLSPRRYVIRRHQVDKVAEGSAGIKKFRFDACWQDIENLPSTIACG